MFVLGAGADVAYGVPTIGTLMVDLAKFARDEGLKISKALRAQLPNIHFSFDKYAGDQGDTLLQGLFASATDISPTLRSVAHKLRSDPDAGPVASVIEQLCSMAENNQLSGADLEGLARLAGEPGDVGEAEPLLDPGKITLSSIPARAVRHAFQQALIRGSDLSETERDTLELFVVATSNIEQLLSIYFTRYTISTPADKKTFLYLSWMLWSFLWLRSVGQPRGQRGIYGRLPVLAGDVITFNYTNFFDSVTLRKVRFFHGRLDHYLHVDTRKLVTDDANLRAAINVDGVVKFVGTLRLDVKDNPAIDLPSIVPPVSFKPVMSRSQLKTWMDCDDLLQRADLIVAVGYSFAMADDHFNDLLRNSNAKTRLIVVNTSLAGPARSSCRILGLDPDQMVSERRGGFDLLRSGRLTAVAARAEDLDEAFLTTILG